MWELRNESEESFEVGGELTVSAFEAGQKVDVTGTSKGKGFAGGVKRWNFPMQDATHGNSSLTVLRVLLVNVRLQVVYLKVRKWPVTWVLKK